MKHFITLLAIFTMAISSAWADETAIAKIGDTEYTDASAFKTALYDLTDDATVTLLDDVSIDEALSTCWEIRGGNIVFDFNGHTILGYILTRCNSIVINDSSEGKTGVIKTQDNFFAISNNANCTINGGTIIGGSPFGTNNPLTVNGGSFQKSGSESKKFTSNKKFNAGEGLAFLLADGQCKTELTINDEAQSYTIVKAIASIGTTAYTDASAFKTALYDLTDDATVTLLDDVSVDNDLSVQWKIKGKNIVFDFNGHVLLGWLNIYSSSIVINDSSEGKTGVIKSKDNFNVVCSYANCTINGGTIIGGSPFGNHDSFTVNGGSFQKSGSESKGFTNDIKVNAGEGFAFLLADGQYKTVLTSSDEAQSYTIVKAIATIGSTYYFDTEEFVNDALKLKGEATITLLQDIDLESKYIYLTLADGADITLDLNGHKMIGWLDIYSSLTVVDSSEDGTGSIVEDISKYIFWMESKSSLTINAGSFVGGGIIYNGGGPVVLNGGKFESTSDLYHVIQLDGGTVSIKEDYEYHVSNIEQLKEITETLDKNGYVGPKSLLPEVKELMGSTIYEEKDGAGDFIFVNDEGHIVNKDNYGSVDISVNYSLTRNGDNYVFTYYTGATVTFYVEGGEITKIIGWDSYVYYPKKSVATGIKNAEAVKTNKAIKVLENGRMIIIRNGEKYDLSGSKL